jgi:hypothetical protein
MSSEGEFTAEVARCYEIWSAKLEVSMMVPKKGVVIGWNASRAV